MARKKTIHHEVHEEKEVAAITQEKLTEAAQHIQNESTNDLQLQPVKSQPVPDEKPKEKNVYSFPTQSRCPRCQTVDTQAVSTQLNVQYRKCLRAVCRHTYTVIGKKV